MAPTEALRIDLSVRDSAIVEELDSDEPEMRPSNQADNQRLRGDFDLGSLIVDPGWA